MVSGVLSLVNFEESCPGKDNVLNAYRHIKPGDVRVVLVGQDPYPRKSDACGISFQSLAALPRSADSIFSNLVAHGHMTSDQKNKLRVADFRGWLSQGVLMTNTSLTVAVGIPNSHREIWRGVTERILANVPPTSVALLLGSEAARLTLPCARRVIHTHPVIPSSEIFSTVDCFGQVNTELAGLGLAPIQWSANSI